MENLHLKKNAELMAIPAIAEALKSGKVVILGITDTKNPEIKLAYLAQTRNDVSTSSGGEIEAFLLGWGTGEQIVRAIQSFKPSVAALTVGATMPEKLNLAVYDGFTKEYESQEPRKRPDGTLIKMPDGRVIYRNAKLVAGAPVHKLETAYEKQTVGTGSTLESFAQAATQGSAFQRTN